MKQIKDIVVTTKTEENILGKIIVKNDNSFEGAVIDGKINFFVFGFLTEKYIELFKTLDRYPIIYRGLKEGKVYRGNILIPDVFEFDEGEDCTIGVYDPENYRDVNLKGEIVGIERQILKIKKGII